MEHFRAYFDAPRTPRDGALKTDGRTLRWSADGFERTDGAGETAAVEPEALHVHLSRWRTDDTSGFRPRTEHWLQVEIRGAGRPFRAAAEVDESVLAGLPWQDAEFERAAPEALAELLAALGFAEVHLAPWLPEATREPPRNPVRRIGFGAYLARHYLFVRVALVVLLPISLACLIWATTSRSSDDAPRQTGVVVEVEALPEHERLVLRDDDTGATNVVSLRQKGWSVGDRYVVRRGKYAPADGPNAPSGPTGPPPRALLFGLLLAQLALMIGGLRWPDFARLRRGRARTATTSRISSGWTTKSRVTFTDHRGETRALTVRSWVALPPEVNVYYDEGDPSRSAVAEAPFPDRIDVDEDRIRHRVSIKIILLLLISPTALALALTLV